MGESETATTENAISKWVLRLVLDKEAMFERNITMDDIHFAIESGYRTTLDCVYSDFNSDKLICRIRIIDKISATGKSDIEPLDQHDQIHVLREIQDNILDNTILRGIRKISKVHMRKVQNNVYKASGVYKKNAIWVLDTVGSNLLDILALDLIDDTRTYSNNIIEMYQVLGIEAVRNCIYNEIVEVIEHSGSYINSHHIDLLCDRMTSTIRLVSIFRHGINNDNIGPIAKASFEETPEMFLRAARHAEMDNMRGVSANIMCGQTGNYGTSAFNIMLDLEDMKKWGEKNRKQDINMNSLFDMIQDDGACSIHDIDLKTNTNIVNNYMSNTDDSYNPGF